MITSLPLQIEQNFFPFYIIKSQKGDFVTVIYKKIYILSILTKLKARHIAFLSNVILITILTQDKIIVKMVITPETLLTN